MQVLTSGCLFRSCTVSANWSPQEGSHPCPTAAATCGGCPRAETCTCRGWPRQSEDPCYRGEPSRVLAVLNASGRHVSAKLEQEVGHSAILHPANLMSDSPPTSPPPWGSAGLWQPLDLRRGLVRPHLPGSFGPLGRVLSATPREPVGFCTQC
jgi:hypothetical protein